MLVCVCLYTYTHLHFIYAEASKAPVRCHTLWQPAPPGTVRPLFPFRRLACLTSCEQRFPAWAESSSWRSFLRGCFPGVGADLGDPTHRGRQNQMDRSMLCRRSLVNCRGPAPADPGYSKQRRRRRGSGNNCLIKR